MKKILLSIIFILSLFLLTACTLSKQVLTTADFSEIMEKKEFRIIDITNQYSENTYVKEATLAINNNNEYQIEFYVLDNKDSAKDMFNKNKRIFDESDSVARSSENVNMINYSYYKVTNDNEFKYICRVENTFIYINTSKDKKDEIINIINDLGY